MHCVFIVGSYGDHWEQFPLFATQGDRLFLFCDHRNNMGRRRERFAEGLAGRPVDSIEMVTVDPPPVDCENDVHPWGPLERGGRTVGAICYNCGAVDAQDDLPLFHMECLEQLLATA